MVKLSRKEYVAITEIIIAIFCLIAFGLLYFVETYPINEFLSSFKISCLAVTLVCLLFSMSTWFCFSNFARARLHTRIFCVVVLWLLFLKILLTAVGCLVYVVLQEKKDTDTTTDKDEDEDEEHEKDEDNNKIEYSHNLLLIIACALAFTVAVILLFMNIFLTHIIIRKYRKRSSGGPRT